MKLIFDNAMAMAALALAMLCLHVLVVVGEDVDTIVPETSKGATFIMRETKEALKKLQLSPYKAHHQVSIAFSLLFPD